MERLGFTDGSLTVPVMSYDKYEVESEQPVACLVRYCALIAKIKLGRRSFGKTLKAKDRSVDGVVAQLWEGLSSTSKGQ